jgi:glyceraldehyde-3-phosphate dehydrogenase (NADP+)
MQTKLHIGGEWIETGAAMPIVNPFTGAEIARVSLGDERTLDSAIAAARAAFATTRTAHAHERAALLRRIAQGIEARREEFAATIVAEAGKPITLTEGEVARAICTFTIAADEAQRWNGGGGEVLALDATPAGAGHTGIARRFPIGVISAITPFNFPLNLVAHKVAPGIATGNTMVVKPAPKTPLTALMLAEVIAAAGAPPGQVNFVTCANEHAARLVTDGRVAMLSFTGSPDVGWPLKTLAGKKRVCLELGGNAGVIVHEDADLADAVPLIAAGAFGNAGQSCISVQRIFAHEKIYGELRARLIAHIRDKVKTGDPLDRTTVVGPMISRDALERARARIANAVAAGGRIVIGGEVRGPCIDATLLEDVPLSHEACREELFAPVATLHRYGDFEEALRFVNDSRFGLQAGVFTRDTARAFHAFEVLDVGGVLINQVPTWRVENMPYGGIKDSGFGREGVRWAMEEMTEIKTMIIRRV